MNAHSHAIKKKVLKIRLRDQVSATKSWLQVPLGVLDFYGTKKKKSVLGYLGHKSKPQLPTTAVNQDLSRIQIMSIQVGCCGLGKGIQRGGDGEDHHGTFAESKNRAVENASYYDCQSLQPGQQRWGEVPPFFSFASLRHNLSFLLSATYCLKSPFHQKQFVSGVAQDFLKPAHIVIPKIG